MSVAYDAGGFRRHTQNDRCPVCDKPDWCRTFDDGWTECMRTPSHRESNGGWQHWTGDGPAPDDWRDRLAVVPPPTPAPPPPDPDPDLRHRGLRVILDRCPLSPAHRRDLADRGLTSIQINTAPFGSLPDDEGARNQVAAAVVDALGPEAYGHVPGLYHDDGAPRLHAYPGLLIGVEQGGRIVGLTIRPNDAAVRAEGGKYRHLSSRAKPGGVGSGAPGGVIFPVGWNPGAPVTRVIVAEGILKGYVISNRTGLPVVAMPGATITADVPRLLAAIGATEPVLAFDTDRATNPNVAAGERGLADRLRDDGFAVTRLTWPAVHKGLDDALAAGVLPLREPVHPTPAVDVGPCSVRLADLQQRYADLSELHSAVMAALGNKGLNAAERIVAVMTLTNVAAEDRGHPPGEAHPIPTVRIAEAAGVSISTATTAIRTLEQGLIAPRDDGDAAPVRLFDRTVKFTPGVVNQKTGEVRDINQAYYTRISPCLSADLRTLAVAEKVKPRAHGGKRTVCPDHPDAGVAVTTTRRCAACARVLSTDVRHEAPEGPNTHLAYLVPPAGDASNQAALGDAGRVNTHLTHSVPLGAEAGEHQPLATAVKGPNTQDAHSVDPPSRVTTGDRPNRQDAKLVQITFPSENVTSLVNLDVSHNDKQPASVGDAWLAGVPLVDVLPIPPPAQDVVLDPVRPALAAADHAHDREERHRTNGRLSASLVELARSRGRLPVPKPPPPEPPMSNSIIDAEVEDWLVP